MRPNWYGIVGWAFMVTAFILAAAVIPWPHNGSAIATILLGLAGALLVTLAVRPQP